jgi:uncharacterized protein (DUF302 family)
MRRARRRHAPRCPTARARAPRRARGTARPRASRLLVGNPTVGKQLFEQDQAVGLYVPIRVSVYADANGKTHVEYDRPSSLLGQFKNEKITMAAKMLDEKLDGLANMAAK